MYVCMYVPYSFLVMDDKKKERKEKKSKTEIFNFDFLDFEKQNSGIY